jgi:hypothetical protein
LSSVIYHKWALHHAATAPKKRLTGLTGLRSVLWSRRLFWPARPAHASGRPLDEGEIDQASWGCAAALLRCDDFAVLQCRRPPVPVAHLLCRHDSDSALVAQIVQMRGLLLVYSSHSSVPGPSGARCVVVWLALVLPRTLYPPCEDGTHEMQSSQCHSVPPVECPSICKCVRFMFTSPSSYFVMSHNGGRLTTGLCHSSRGGEAH